MKAIILKEFAAVDNLVIEELAIPTIKNDEVLVKVKAISINPVDVKHEAAAATLAALTAWQAFTKIGQLKKDDKVYMRLRVVLDTMLCRLPNTWELMLLAHHP